MTTALVTGDQTLLLKHTISVTLNCLVVASAMHSKKEEAKKEDVKSSDVTPTEEVNKKSKKSKKTK